MSSNKKVNLKKVILSAAIILLTLAGVFMRCLGKVIRKTLRRWRIVLSR